MFKDVVEAANSNERSNIREFAKNQSAITMDDLLTDDEVETAIAEAHGPKQADREERRKWSDKKKYARAKAR